MCLDLLSVYVGTGNNHQTHDIWYLLSVYVGTGNNHQTHDIWYLLSVYVGTGNNHVSFANRTDRNDITEILLKVALNTITLTLLMIWSI
jgi:uncharacterized lipoprotein NlpE involved in copper resistance